jgi:NADPH-dependent 2,4-dienoyl-CoA reductase/sulfur reductase-like enzyme
MGDLAPGEHEVIVRAWDSSAAPQPEDEAALWNPKGLRKQRPPPDPGPRRIAMSQPLDVLAVGAGPVGLALACELRRRGAACRVVDRATAPTDKSKAVVLHRG